MKEFPRSWFTDDTPLESGHVTPASVVPLVVEFAEISKDPTAEKLCALAQKLARLATDNGRLARPWLHILWLEVPGLTEEMLQTLCCHDVTQADMTEKESAL